MRVDLPHPVYERVEEEDGTAASDVDGVEIHSHRVF
jgi:hypothetical protein